MCARRPLEEVAMETLEETRQSVRELLTAQRFAVLSTESETGPYCSLIAFWAADDLTHVVFATMRSTRKFNFLITHPRVALLFDNRANRETDITESTAVTATGTAREVTEVEARSAMAAAFLARTPRSSHSSLTRVCLRPVDIDAYLLVTSSRVYPELACTAPLNGLGGDGAGKIGPL